MNIDEKIARERVWQATHAQQRTSGIVRGKHISMLDDARCPRGYAYAWINEQAVYTTDAPMSLGDVFRTMKHNDGYEIINLDTQEVVMLKLNGATRFYPDRNIYSTRRKEYAPCQRRKYDYFFTRECLPFAPTRFSLERLALVNQRSLKA